MIDFLNKYIDKPVSKFITDNPELSFGLGALGLGTAGYLFWRQKKTGEDVVKSWKEYKSKYNDATSANIEKLRRASKLKLKADYVKPEDMKEAIGTENNAFFIPKDFADVLEKDKRFKTDRKTDKKFGHIYYTDSTKSLPVIAHEYGHGESAYKGTAPTMLGNLGRKVLAGALGFGTGKLLYASGVGPVSSVLAGALASTAADYIVDKYTVDEEELASENARRYLKALKHSNKRMSDNEKVLNSALETYKQDQRYRVLRNVLSPIVGLGLLGGGAVLAHKYM